MGKLFKIITWIIVLIVIYIWFSTVIKSCSSETASSTVEQIHETTEDFIDDSEELFSETTDELFEDQDIDYSSSETMLEDDVIKEEIIEEEIIDDTPTPPPTRYTQSVSSGQYMLIAGNYLVESNATEMTRKLSNLGFENAEVAIFNASQYHTVIASRYSDYGDALDASSDLKAKGIDCYVKKKT